MQVIWCKRYRMEFSLRAALPKPRPLDPRYHLLAWRPELLEAHARTKFESFREELDANVFESLGKLAGCKRLMRDIVFRAAFVPEATWLAVCLSPGQSEPEWCGTIQGLAAANGRGSIQNVGVTPAHRGKGVAQHLLAAALAGFQERGLGTASLEVTAMNREAVCLYSRFGFSIQDIVYKPIEVSDE